MCRPIFSGYLLAVLLLVSGCSDPIEGEYRDRHDEHVLILNEQKYHLLIGGELSAYGTYSLTENILRLDGSYWTIHVNDVRELVEIWEERVEEFRRESDGTLLGPLHLQRQHQRRFHPVR